MNNSGQDLKINNDFWVVLWVRKQQNFEGVSAFKKIPANSSEVNSYFQNSRLYAHFQVE